MDFKEHFMKIIEVKIEGKNIERIIRRMKKNNINLLHIYKKRDDCIHVFIYNKDYSVLDEIKTIYKIEIVKVRGILYFIEWVKLNSILFLSLFIGVCFLLFLSHMIFSVEVIHTDKELRVLLLNELEERGIMKYRMKRNYDKIEKIKEEILEKYKDRIEWLEIEGEGTKYIIRVEERLLNQKEEILEPQDIVAKKSAIIYRIDAKTGQVVKNKMDYVHPGDVIISGNVMLNEEVKKQIAATGTVYGEVWYQVSVEYPLHYEETIYTNKKKKVLSFHFLNYSFDLFNFKKYKEKETKSNILVKDSLFPIYFSIDTQREVHMINEDYSEEEAINKAISTIRKKIESNLSKEEYIIAIKKLKVEQNQSTIILDAFVTVYEDITDTRKITMDLNPENIE